jgi:hypothetical protein
MEHKFKEGTAAPKPMRGKKKLKKFSLPCYNLANMLKTQSAFLALYENQSVISKERMTEPYSDSNQSRPQHIHLHTTILSYASRSPK